MATVYLKQRDGGAFYATEPEGTLCVCQDMLACMTKVKLLRPTSRIVAILREAQAPPEVKLIHEPALRL